VIGAGRVRRERKTDEPPAWGRRFDSVAWEQAVGHTTRTF
jgi:hypothetical protein